MTLTLIFDKTAVTPVKVVDTRTISPRINLESKKRRLFLWPIVATIDL
jgi:hypothetical protein